MLPELSDWIGIYSMLKSDLFAGKSLEILDRAAATEADFDVFLQLDNTLNTHKIEQLERRKLERGG